MPSADLPTPAMPRHIAVIMDGNGRWAYRRHLPRVAGHRRGAEVVREMVQSCVDLGIPYLTLFAFSTENWRRPAIEVRLLMNLFRLLLRREARKLHENGVRLRIIGDRGALDPEICQLIDEAETLTRDNQRLQLNLAVNYGGRWDIAQAARAAMAAVQAGDLALEDFSAAHIARHLCLADIPEPDLLIRTGGEERISNFLVWQLAYTEFYFSDTLWPDFNRAALEHALQSFAHRQRRFGRTGDQVLEGDCSVSD
ncbi:MAG: polyprenyl diphosphate synthase [Acidithiobacillus ferrooxidans]|uniref:Polyprenyl diphosphate synthase n=1 Tax=Acidithiobacillus ferruginosus TaxID=3063951 RepID=A0ACD5IKE1_9PROT|nr:polyprenyl diphosphate synthase [Acidithiobacillus ferruginosus]MDD2747315.1 polyprenyl diphosphate synthase [Acidithiobacillus ferrooxidans]MDD5003630.1 polyprenyl diphosphate synthase [Acidithiobacillus sp.]MBU2812859.1 di-trans,poly-cis-decaprenylcistransferase [Acidithiobacillus ferruginosus]MDD5379594.1 polyprenyl diphosphate synthase [Acidithiobacillus sp.]MDD5576954.1 polyprenyl diphosphate synthase [Acidithiobacillus sp.]